MDDEPYGWRKLGLQDGDGKSLCVRQYSERGKEKDSSVVDPYVDARMKSLDQLGRSGEKISRELRWGSAEGCLGFVEVEASSTLRKEQPRI